MIGFIAKKEFQNNIATAGFIIGLLLCLTLIPYTVFTGIQTYKNRLAQYELDVKAADDVYRKASVYAQVKPLLVKPVSPLSIFSKGILEQTGSKVTIKYLEKPVFSADIVSLNENPFMGGFLSLDFVTAIAILLSLLGVLFSYDMLSREKEQGTLKFALSNPVSRSTFFLGKIAGIFLTLVPILVLCFLVILLIIQFSPAVQFSAGDYGRIGLLLLISLVYFAFFVFLGGFISSRTQSSKSSIILNLFIWCFLLFLLPNAAAWLGKNMVPVKDYKQLQFETGGIDKEWLDVQLKEVEEILRTENLGATSYHLYNGGWAGAEFTIFTPRETMEYERRKKELAIPLLLSNCARKWAIQSDYLQQVYRQERTMRYLTCLSPSGIFKHIAAALCHTGIDSEVHFMNRTRQFHDAFHEYLTQNKIFSSYAYFTPQKEEDFPNSWEESEVQRDEWEKQHKDFDFFEARNVGFSQSFGQVDMQSLPRFTGSFPRLGSDLYGQMYLIAGIFIICLLLFWFSFVSFIKYDVR
ncbi:MAG: ABC transporter permease subunit [Dysgonamonadaceae bacterium]|jgi:ABC-type transport system involved in multi-copper enzyme maturation permease subunit|nr:ABC transporter permease subunit [Dysgonamonadaceae bacterium]